MGNAVRRDDPSADPDGDGPTNAQEEDAGTHPNGQLRRFLAEGATGRFFNTCHLARQSESHARRAPRVLTFDCGNGTRVRRPARVPAGRSRGRRCRRGDRPRVHRRLDDRRERPLPRRRALDDLGRAADGAIHGAHAETASPSPSPTWFLAEGLTVLGFDLFYLLQNPQPTTVHATVNLLLPSVTTISRTYTLAPSSRTTI